MCGKASAARPPQALVKLQVCHARHGVLTFSCLLRLSQPRALRFPPSRDAPITEAGQGRVIPLLAGARVFPEAQPREWAPPASSSSEGLCNNSEASSRALNAFTIAFGPTTHYRSRRLFTRRHFPVIPSNSPIIFDLVGPQRLFVFLFGRIFCFFELHGSSDS